MLRMRILLGVAVAAAAVGLTANVQGQSLSGGQRELVSEGLIPAYQAGNAEAVLQFSQRLTSRLREAQWAAVDEMLGEQELPPLGLLLLEARVALSRDGTRRETPRARPAEVERMLAASRAEMAELQAKLRETTVLADALPHPEKLPDYHPLFSLLAEAQGRIEASLARANAALGLPERGVDSDALAGVRSQREALEQLAQRARERELELRLQRLDDAVATLAKSDDLKARYLAAHLVDVDGSSLASLFSNPEAAPPTPFANPRLNDPGLAAEIRAKVQQGTDLAGPLMDKSRQLFAGVQWWLRGRYGRGVQFFGLVKADLAKRSPEALQGLYMPYALPSADDPESSAAYDYPERRHHYVWQWETRSVQVRRRRDYPAPRSSGDGTTPTQTGSPSTRLGNQGLMRIRGARRGGGGSRFSGGLGGTTRWSLTRGSVAFDRLGWSLSDLYRRMGFEPPRYSQPSTSYQPPKRTRESYAEAYATYIPDQDPYAIVQLVGFLEYSTALFLLDELASSLNADELRAIDELIQELDELAVETNLSRGLETRPTALSEPPQRAGDDFRRRGLAWMTALARAELGAMLAGLADQPDALIRLASPRDREQYAELVVDGLRTHYWSLVQDPYLRTLLSGRGDANRTLAYFRRTLVAQGFLRAAVRAIEADGAPEKLAELQAMKRSLDEIQAALATRIAGYHQSTASPADD